MTLQSAAIPYRYDHNGEIQILLVTSRKKGRWVLPKGHVRHGMVPHSSAAKEAFEEGGVIGRTEGAPIASYVRRKKGAEEQGAIKVDIYPLAVAIEAPAWPEMYKRERRWMTVADAMTIVLDKKIRQVLTIFNDAYAARSHSEPTP